MLKRFAPGRGLSKVAGFANPEWNLVGRRGLARGSHSVSCLLDLFSSVSRTRRTKATGKLLSVGFVPLNVGLSLKMQQKVERELDPG